jgi:hypothetical protein
VTAARGALKFLKGEIALNAGYRAVNAGENVNFVVPQRIRGDVSEETSFYLRVKKPMKNVQLTCAEEGVALTVKRGSRASHALRRR